MPKDIAPERVIATAAAARVPLPRDGAARIARAVTMPVTRFAAARIALDMEVEPATFVVLQRKDAQS
jgi:hypothetical protein